MDVKSSSYGLIMAEPAEKFGITNEQDTVEAKSRKLSAESETSQKDGASVSSSASSVSVPGSLSHYLPLSLQRHGYAGFNANEAKDSTSDSEKSGPFKLKLQSSYTQLENDPDHQVCTIWLKILNIYFY